MAPAQKPGRSRQDYATPRPFLMAMQRRFGVITFDLAATAENSVASSYYFGPGSQRGEDSLTADWDHDGLGWLNPPFEDIAPWAAKCAAMRTGGAPGGRQVALLVPASVGAIWYAQHVAPHAYVFALRPRLSFDGVAQYPKDLILALYEPAGYRGFEPWDWTVQPGAEEPTVIAPRRRRARALPAPPPQAPEVPPEPTSVLGHGGSPIDLGGGGGAT